MFVISLFCQTFKVDSLEVEKLIAKGDSLTSINKLLLAEKNYESYLENINLTTLSLLEKKLVFKIQDKLLDKYLFEDNKYKKAIKLLNKVRTYIHYLDSLSIQYFYYSEAIYYSNGLGDHKTALLKVFKARNYVNSSKRLDYSNFFLSLFYMRLGYYTKSINFAKKVKINSVYKKNTYYNLGMCFSLMSNFIKSEYYFRKELLIHQNEKKNNNVNIALGYLNLGYIYNISYKNLKALKYFKKSKNYYENNSLTEMKNYYYSILFMNIAVSKRFLNRLDSAVYYDKKALEYANLLSQTNSKPNLYSHGNLTLTYILKKDYRTAYSHAKMVLKRYEDHPSPLLGAVHSRMITLSQYYPEIDTFEHLKRALSLFIPYYNTENGLMPEITFDLLNSNIYELFQNTQEALYYKVLEGENENEKLVHFANEFSEYYLKYLKKYKESYPNSHFSPFFNKPYEKSLFRYMNYQFKNEEQLGEGLALDRVLNASLMLFNYKISHKLLTDETLENEKLQDQVHLLNEHRNMLDYYQNSVTAENKDENIFKYNEKIDSVLSIIRRESPLLENFQKDFDIKETDELAKHLKKDEAIVKFMSLDGQLFTILIKKDHSISRKKVIKNNNLNKKLKAYLNAINFIDIKKSEDLSESLHEIFFSNIQDELKGIQKLYLLPYADLAQIPFESLSYIRNEKRRYLIEDHEVSYHLSLPLLRKSLERNDSISFKKLFALAPVFSNKISIGRISTDTLTYNLLKMRTVNKDSSLVELKESKNEVEEISELFNEANGESSVYIRSEATEEKFRTNYNRHNVIHLATHSVSNLKDPSESKIFLSYTNKSDYKNDGIISYNEIQNMRINSDLIVLSSCESGLGKVIRGEGNLNLSSAFYASGAKNIVNSLWKVFDKETKSFMVLFYKKLLENNSISRALRETKLEYIRSENKQLMKYWAGFVQLGIN
jgi:CHAT domain-containing protein